MDATPAPRSGTARAAVTPTPLNNGVTTNSMPPVVAPSLLDSILFELKRVIVGQDLLLERLLVALLARGHVLIEGVPGVAKTLTVKSLAQVIGGTFGRVQFTPDLVPSDLTGTRIYNAKMGEFTTEPGPLFVNVLLADEINRAPAKVQSALLEVMQERQVTIARQSLPVPNPFFVLATQNPIEQDGTYPLPEAQLDRFLFKVLVQYPSYQEELIVIERQMSPAIQINPLLVTGQMVAMQQTVDQVYVDPRVREYAATLVAATRKPAEFGLSQFASAIQLGGSPRASIGLILAARALAFVRKRHYVLPQDVADLLPDVLRHRLLLTYDAIADEVSSEAIIHTLLEKFPPQAVEMAEK
jgi:MoxR-like ATPase